MFILLLGVVEDQHTNTNTRNASYIVCKSANLDQLYEEMLYRRTSLPSGPSHIASFKPLTICYAS